MSKHDFAPRIKEQHKDNAIAVEKNAPSAAELRQKQTKHKEEEIQSNRKNEAESKPPHESLP